MDFTDRCCPGKPGHTHTQKVETPVSDTVVETEIRNGLPVTDQTQICLQGKVRNGLPVTDQTQICLQGYQVTPRENPRPSFITTSPRPSAPKQITIHYWLTHACMHAQTLTIPGTRHEPRGNVTDKYLHPANRLCSAVIEVLIHVQGTPNLVRSGLIGKSSKQKTHTHTHTHSHTYGQTGAHKHTQTYSSMHTCASYV